MTVLQETTARSEITPTVCDIKVRLLLHLHLSKEKNADVLVKLLKPFVQELTDQACILLLTTTK
jgi:hypothetical protein